MPAKYFRLLDDLEFPNRWHLNRLVDSSGVELDGREFTYGRAVELGPPIKARTWKIGRPVDAQPPLKLLLNPSYSGNPLDFTFSDEDVPVVTTEIAELLTSIAPSDFQSIPVQVESRREPYAIINITRTVECIDASRSEIQWFAPGNTIRPDLAGKPEMITRLVIDAARLNPHHITRVADWSIAVVVSEFVKDVLESIGATGVTFRQVSA